jgi:hypothetical protein
VRVIDVPAELEERSLDGLVRGVAAGSGRALVDALRLRWIDPYGMLGLLAAGEVLGRNGERPILRAPASADVSSYLRRMGFFEAAQGIFEVHGEAAAAAAGGGGARE